MRSVSKRKPTGEEGLVYLYESDFSSGIDNWSELSGVDVMAGNESIGGQSDALRVSCEAAAGKATQTVIRSLSALSSGDIVSGNDYEVRLSYYIPSANDEVLYISQIGLGNVDTAIDTGAVTTDAWLDKTVTFTATSTSTVFVIRMNEDHESGARDQFYLKNISVREL